MPSLKRPPAPGIATPTRHPACHGDVTRVSNRRSSQHDDAATRRPYARRQRSLPDGTTRRDTDDDDGTTPTTPTSPHRPRGDVNDTESTPRHDAGRRPRRRRRRRATSPANGHYDATPTATDTATPSDGGTATPTPCRRRSAAPSIPTRRSAAPTARRASSAARLDATGVYVRSASAVRTRRRCVRRCPVRTSTTSLFDPRRGACAMRPTDERLRRRWPHTAMGCAPSRATRCVPTIDDPRRALRWG